VLWGSKAGWLPDIVEGAGQFNGLWRTYLVLAITYAIISVFLIITSRRLFTGWLTALVTVVLLFCGLSFYFYIAVASMTNPPVNWGYARTLEGFIHTISRGQFEHLNPANLLEQPGRYFDGVWHYSIETFHAVG